MRRQNLKEYKTPQSWNRGASIFKEILWAAIFKPIVRSSFPGSKWRKICLIIFGADLGKGIRLSSSLNITMPWRLKIGDFGLAVRITEEEPFIKSWCGTPNYMSPEQLKETGHSYEADIWAVGVIMYYLMFKKAPFSNKNR